MKTFRLGKDRIRFAVNPKGTMDSVRQLASRCHQSIINQYQQPKSGKQYRRGGKTHTASAPGEPPAVDTGLLAANTVMRQHPKGVVVGVPQTAEKVPPSAKGSGGRPRIEYAARLETGAGRVKARPYFRPAIIAALRGKILPRDIITTSKFGK